MKTLDKKIVLFLLLVVTTVSAQIGVGTRTPHPDAMLEVKSTNKGLLLPRVALVSTTSVAPLSTHVEGMSVYNTATTSDVTPGYYYNDGGKWVRLVTGLVADATTLSRGIIQLAGDLAGSATAPLVKTGAITNTKLADDAVTTAKIENGAISNVKLANNAVTNAKIGEIVSLAKGGSGTDMTSTSGYVKQATIGAGFTTVNKIPVAEVDGAVQKVNGSTPDANGNVTVSFGTVFTGTINNRGTVVATPNNGDMYVVSGDANAANNGITYIFEGTNWQEITANQSALDARYLKLAGGTLAGSITVPTGKNITVTDAPTAATDAANKDYVDSKVADATIDATTTLKGIIQLAGDLSGTALAPLVKIGAITNTKLADDSVTNSKIGEVISVAKGGTGKDMTTTSGYVIQAAAGAGFTTVNAIPVAEVTGAVQKVNGSTPDANGNVTVAFGTVYTGTSVARGTVVTNPKNGDMYVVSGDATTTNNGITYIFAGTNWQEITANQSSLDARYLKLAGGTLAGSITVPTGKNITVTDAPTAATDAANKAYVDSQITAVATPEASVTITGKIKLAGDLTGTAALPEVALGAITATKLAADAVTTVKITDANVTEAKLAADAVTSAKIKDGQVTLAKLATTGTADATTFLRGDGKWALPAYKGLVLCAGTLTQDIPDTNVTDTSSIYVSYEDASGDLILTTIKSRVSGIGFKIQFGAIPSTTAKINYIIVQ